MSPAWRANSLPAALLVGAVALTGAACEEEAPASRSRPNLLDHAGEGAAVVAGEWWIMFTLSVLVVLLVFGLMLAAAFRGRRHPADLGATVQPAPGRANWWIGLGGVALPVAVLTVVLAISVGNVVALSSPPEEEAFTIEVIGHRWWWEVRYPEAGIATANEVRVPVGVPVRIVLRSNDVIHSFWVPRVHGKMDLIPGRENTMWLQASVAGAYRGICAEFCGLQHARMHFMLVAMPEPQFDEWLERQRQPAREPDTDLEQLGRDVFVETTCAFCHTIRGTPARGTVGPDLTHLGERLTLAAGMLDNNAGNLGGWIVDPQRLKPGALMPPAELTGEELTALVAYLRSLR